MVEMSLKELFEIGQSFESSVGEGTKGERARIFKNNSRLNLTDEMISFIESIDYEVNLLVSGEIWCPDFQLNATVLKRFLDLNTNFNMSVITMARGKKFMAPALGIDKESFKGPSIAVLDKDFNVLGLFEERPQVVRDMPSFDDIKLEYYKGKYLLDTVNDFIKILKKL